MSEVRSTSCPATVYEFVARLIRFINDLIRRLPIRQSVSAPTVSAKPLYAG